MNTLREALRDYLSMRRGLGFQLREAGKALADFIAFLEERKARYITRELALEVGVTTAEGPAGGMGPTPRFCARFRPISPRD
jgi:hypothetical protein